MTCCLLSKGVKMWCAAFIHSFPSWRGIAGLGLLPSTIYAEPGASFKNVYCKIVDIPCSIHFRLGYFIIGSPLIVGF